MESVHQNSKHIVKYNFQVILEDEDEEEKDSLLMESWIYLDLTPDEEMSYDKIYQITDKNKYNDSVNDPEKLGGKLKLPQSESFPVVTSHTSQTLPSTSSQDNGRTFGVCMLENKNCIDETTYVNVSRVVSSGPPPSNLCSKTETRKQSLDVCKLEVENAAKTPASGISEPYLSMEIDSTTNTNETSMYSPDVYSLNVKNALEIPHIHASNSYFHDAGNSVVNPNETCRNYTDVISVDRNYTDIPNEKLENTTEAVHTCASKSFLHEAVDSVVNPNENCRNYTDVLRVDKNYTDIPNVELENTTEAIQTCASKSFLQEAVDSVVSPNENCRNYTDGLSVNRNYTNVSSVKVENTAESIDTDVSKSFLPVVFHSNMCPSMKTGSKCPAEGQITLVTSKQQKRNFSEDETSIITISDDDSDDCDIVYVGTCQSSNACDNNKHEKPSVDKRMKCEHKNNEQTTHAAVIDDVSDDDMVIYEEKCVPKLTGVFSRPGKVMTDSEASNKYQGLDVIIEKIVPTISEPKVKKILPNKKNNFPEISIIDTDSAKNVFIDDTKHISNSRNKFVPRFWQESESYPTIQTRDY